MCAKQEYICVDSERVFMNLQCEITMDNVIMNIEIVYKNVRIL